MPEQYEYNFEFFMNNYFTPSTISIVDFELINTGYTTRNCVSSF